MSWDLIRVTAVLSVMLFHGTWVAVGWYPELGERAFVWEYAVGASTLLVLSGYFAAAAVARHDALRWWLGRLFRILPAFWAAVLVTATAQRAFAREGWWAPTWPDVGANLAMLWQWKPQTYPYVDVSYWTLPIQLVGFAAVTAVAVWRARHPSPRVVVLLWAALATEAVLWPIRVHAAWEPFRMLHDGLGWHRLHLFVIGVAIFLIQRGRVSRAHGGILILVGLLEHEVQLQDLATTAVLAVCIGPLYLAAVGPDWDSVLPQVAFRPVRWLAGISYGVYLTHFSLGVLVMRYLHQAGASPGTQVLGLVTTGILVGWLLTTWVERPAYRALCRWRDQRIPRFAAARSGTHGAGTRRQPVPAAGGTRPAVRPASSAVVVLGTSVGAVLVLAALGLLDLARSPAVTLAALCAFACLVTGYAPARVRAAFGVAGTCWLLHNALVIPEIGHLRWDPAVDPRRMGLLLAAALLGIAVNRLRNPKSVPPHATSGGNW